MVLGDFSGSWMPGNLAVEEPVIWEGYVLLGDCFRLKIRGGITLVKTSGARRIRVQGICVNETMRRNAVPVLKPTRIRCLGFVKKSVIFCWMNEVLWDK
jgi:hypothetical protein